jgi:hypothetical protein
VSKGKHTGDRIAGATNLAGLAGTKQKHLDLVLCHHAVSLELAFNLIVAYEERERAVMR